MEKLDEILSKLSNRHSFIIKDLLEKFNRCDNEYRNLYGCYFRGYINCLVQSELIDCDEWKYLRHLSLFEEV